MILGFYALPVLAETAPQAEKALALTFGCQGCHGASGEGQGSMPPLRTLDPQRFIQRFQAFAQDEKTASPMHRIARGYNADEVRLMAELLAQGTKGP